MRNSYMLLYLRTGGGHYAPARAVADVINGNRAMSCRAQLVDGLDGSAAWLRNILEGGYRFLQGYARWYYMLLYFVTQFTPIARAWSFIVSILITPALERRILADPPAHIAVFHFFLIKPVTDILKKHRLAVPVLVVVTDPFSAHPIWFIDKSLRFAVFSERLKEECVAGGIETNHISVFPGIVDERFTAPPRQEHARSLRETLGVIRDQKIVLLLGGKDGMPNAVKLVRSINRTTPNYSVVVVCGENLRLRKKLERLRRSMNWKHVVVMGFADDVCTLMSIADVVVTKCGASTCMETLMSKKISIVHRYLWGQEKGNVEFLTSNNLGFYEPRPAGVALRISGILNDPLLRARILRNIDQAGIRNGAPMVAGHILRESVMHVEERSPKFVIQPDGAYALAG